MLWRYRPRPTPLPHCLAAHVQQTLSRLRPAQQGHKPIHIDVHGISLWEKTSHRNLPSDHVGKNFPSKAGKQFFFEKKNQKTLTNEGISSDRDALTWQKFLLLFSKRSAVFLRRRTV
jgi:hypothetical protein